MKSWLCVFTLAAASLSTGLASAAEPSPWTIDVGVRWFKYSAESAPSEIGPNRVFDRWESVNQDRENFAVSAYTPLTPLYFNFSFGADVMVRFRRHLMLKLGYDYSNPFGIGGSGSITYTDRSSGIQHHEQKRVSYTSHQITTFIGPAVPIGDDAEIYMGLSSMAPTWVTWNVTFRYQVL